MKDMINALEKFLAKSRLDYAQFHNRGAMEDSPIRRLRREMIQEYNDGLKYEFGRKYIRVFDRGSAHSFIVMKDEGKFKRGDILKCASWRSPATNFSRGNIFGEYTIRWTGA